MKDQLKEFKEGNPRALSRLITLVENQDPRVMEVMKEIHDLPSHAKTLGITGPPGAGKSTLINAFVRFLRSQGKKVGVVAVDPVSPFSGGALLGDRIRLLDHFTDPGVFIRSLSTRGTLGGLSCASRQVMTLLDRFGFDWIIFETVGVGQSEVDVRKICDLTLVVLVPEWGDSVQALKAGILEIADIFTVHKNDREGAARIVNDLKSTLQLSGRTDVEVLETSINEMTTVEALLSTIDNTFKTKAGLITERRKVAVRETVVEFVRAVLGREAETWAQKSVSGSGNPYQVLKEFFKKHPQGSFFAGA